MAIRRQSESSDTALSSEQLTRLRQLAEVLREVPSQPGRQLNEEDCPELIEAFEILRAAGVRRTIAECHISPTRQGYFIASDAPQLTARFIDKLVDEAFGRFLDKTCDHGRVRGYVACDPRLVLADLSREERDAAAAARADHGR